MPMVIAEAFKSLAERYNSNHQQTEIFWTELTKCYSGKGRYYHTLDHLDELFKQLMFCKDQINDMDSVLFALYYHDAVYNILRKDNEERSASLAVKRLMGMGVPEERIIRSRQHILATKSHIISDDSNTNYFTDADLAILGQEWDTYKIYVQQIRKEYAIYPDMVYNPGRKKVLQHFLQMSRIYKTDAFHQNFESQARKNIEMEIVHY